LHQVLGNHLNKNAASRGFPVGANVASGLREYRGAHQPKAAFSGRSGLERGGRKSVIATQRAPTPILPPDHFGNIVPSIFTPVLAKHLKSFSVVDAISVGVDRMQRNFDPMRKQVEV
jgi:hypothetical protein